MRKNNGEDISIEQLKAVSKNKKARSGRSAETGVEPRGKKNVEKSQKSRKTVWKVRR
jgi:hypothetical protein